MIENGWGDYSQTYIVMLFKSHWAVDDYAQAVVAIYSKMAQVDHDVNFIIDLRYSGTPPTSILPTITRSITQRPNNLGRVVVVSRTTIWKRIFNTIMSSKKDQMFDLHFVTTMDDAYPLILSVSAFS